MNTSFKCFFLAVFFCFFCAEKGEAQEKSAAAKLKGDLRVHDPVMINQDCRYYVFSTGKGISIKTSEDMVHWEKVGSVFGSVSLPAWHKYDIPEQDGHLWAPDVHYRNGKYHLYYSVSAWMNFDSSIGYATNTTLDPEDPDYKWIDKGQVISFKNGGEGVNVIDPNIFIAEDGKVWLFYGSYQKGLRMVELDPETGLLKNNPPEITKLTTSLGEGVFIIKGPTYNYIFASRGICCKGLDSNYQVVVGRSKELQGPYLNKRGESWLENKYTLFLEGDQEEPGKGHNAFFVEDDITYIVYHAYTRSAEGASLLNIDPLFVSDDGWPTMENTGKYFKMADFQQKVFSGK